MASSSSSSPRTWRYRVFTSFHGPDVRKTFLSHLRKQFDGNGITMFDDQRIERGHTISPSLTRAIRESRISIVILSKNYASSGWCLDELLEILKCKEDIGQIVMTIFYEIDPSDVRKQTGDFGSVFKETCSRRTKEESERWSQALNDVGNIAGEHLLNWDNEAKMIEKIAKDVSNKLNVTPSRDFDGMVGLEAHLMNMKSLLDLEYDEVKMVAISGPAGIGKTTIARALHSLLSNRFQLTCFVDNLRGSYPVGLDEYGLKLRLQEQLLSNILNENGMRISHLGAIKERLCDMKVLITLDDVNDARQLEALANEISWFGLGSRIIVTTENKDLLQQHGIDNTYHVWFPSDDQALTILCRYAFRQVYPADGFQELARRVRKLCGNLPLGLRVVGSSLRGKNEDEWKYMMRRLETIIDRDIEEVLRVGYERLHEDEQSLFLHIAVFFNYKDDDLVKAMLADSSHNNFDIEQGLKLLVKRSLIYMSTKGFIMMHKLLQQMGRQVIQRQEPWKRQILVNAQDICDVFENDDTGTGSLSGISFDTLGIKEVTVSNRALRRMRNLRFLKVYNSNYDAKIRVHIPEEMEFPPRLRLLHWEAYPSKSLLPTFNPEFLVELNMQASKLEKLWKGTQPLENLKRMDLSQSLHLKELPDLSNATNLERLDLSSCSALAELPTSIGNLHKLKKLMMGSCDRLQVIPTNINLASLEWFEISGCSRLKTFPDISTNIKDFSLSDTSVEEVPESIRNWSQLSHFDTSYSGILKSVTHLPESIEKLDLSSTDIEMIPDCIKDLQGLKSLRLFRCRRLRSLPELPGLLELLMAEDCGSLERVTCPFNTQYAQLSFINCFKLGEEARRVIIQRLTLSRLACLPGKIIPSEFNHRARGSSLTITRPSSAPSTFKVCVVISSIERQHVRYFVYVNLQCRIVGSKWCDYPDVVGLNHHYQSTGIRTEHLCIFHAGMPAIIDEALFEFSISQDPLDEYEIVECGVQILTGEWERMTDEIDQVSEDEDDEWSDDLEEDSEDNSE
ncbi:unnamed protein product [Microthlaspi erraticum]|uniref:ADP-ribosyl cyclase/cyclic ADP-ribose hydrolase n=1 Tax=Microthlaspi erraticum TaxID=1685480 RepID=A0A6D2KA15_9BRAS|nr:unnamed protein product [Microthlaspi erraticum]